MKASETRVVIDAMAGGVGPQAEALLILRSYCLHDERDGVDGRDWCVGCGERLPAREEAWR
jgi:hypothetical protein